MSGDLLRALAHELRNSIAPIVNAAHLIRLRGGSDPELASMLSIIDRQIASMTRTLDAIGEADRLTRGDAALQRQRLELGAVVHCALQGRKAVIDSRGQRVQIVSGPRPVWVDADQARLIQAIGNVLDNASRYSDDGGEITVEVGSSGAEAEVRIGDNGRGIAADVLPRVFEGFGLRPPARTGLGLGLAIARAICERHGGRIAARSGGEGRGSDFTISLPVASQAAETAWATNTVPKASATPTISAATERSATTEKSSATATSATSHTPGSRRILVADDNQAVRNSFAAILQEMGHDVRLAADGMQAVEVAESWSPEFVIVDVHMPKIDGYTVARKLRARFPPSKMQLVMMSGTDLDPMTLMGAKQAGFDHCVDKTLAVKGIDALIRGEAPPMRA